MEFSQFVQEVAQFEGYSSVPYKCPGGFLTIGYGKRIKESEIKKYQALSKLEMDDIFYNDLHVIYIKLKLKFPKHSRYAHIDNIILAITDFVYNCGTKPLYSSTTALGFYFKRITSSKATFDDLYQFASVLLSYCNAGIKPLKGLQRRRLYEFRLLMNL